MLTNEDVSISSIDEESEDENVNDEENIDTNTIVVNLMRGTVNNVQLPETANNNDEEHYPSSVMTVEEANLAYRRLKAKYNDMYLENASNKHLVVKLKVENAKLNKLCESQVNKNVNVVKLCEGSEEKYRLTVSELNCTNREIAGLNKLILESNAKQHKIEFLKIEYDS